MKKILLLFLFIVHLFSNENVTIQLNWKYQFEFAGFIMAKEKGFYKEVGLNVKLKELTKTSSDIVKWVSEKSGRYGVGNSALLARIIEHHPIELLMPIFDKSPLVLTAVNLPNLKSLRDITTNQLVVGQLALKEPALLAMLKSKNIKLDEINFEQENFYNNITKPAVYAFYLSNEIYTLKKEHIPFKIFDPQTYGFSFYGDILFTSKQEALQYPNRTRKIMEATRKGYIYAFNHIEETIKVLEEKYNTQNFSKDKYLYEAKILKKYLSKSFLFDIGRLEDIQKVYIILGLLDKPFDIRSYIFTSFKFNAKELSFIHKHLIRAITTYSWEPFNLEQNGELKGIAIDYWKYIKNSANLKSTCIINNNWNNVLNAIKTKQADITCSTTITPDRVKYALFSKPYVSFPIVVATRNDVGFVSDLSLLNNKILAVGRNYTAEKLLRKHYPNIKLVEVENSDEALKLVSEGKVFGAVDILPVIAYKINQYEYANLKISGKTPWLFDVRFMVRKDYPELVSIINKVIDTIPESKKQEIYQKWVSVKYQKGYTENYIYKILLIGLIIISIFIILVLYLLKNIKEKSILEGELKTLATMDKLTSIFNRYKIDMALNEQIEIAKRYKRPLSIVFFDIDHFKYINDNYGHQKGDEVLISLTKLVSKNIRSSDIFGRWGGEEFLLLLPETTLQKAIILAEKLRKTIENHNICGIKVTCSFGVTTVNNNDSINTVIERVDRTLYESKENGRNRVSYIENDSEEIKSLKTD